MSESSTAVQKPQDDAKLNGKPSAIEDLTATDSDDDMEVIVVETRPGRGVQQRGKGLLAQRYEGGGGAIWRPAEKAPASLSAPSMHRNEGSVRSPAALHDYQRTNGALDGVYCGLNGSPSAGQSQAGSAFGNGNGKGPSPKKRPFSSVGGSGGATNSTRLEGGSTPNGARDRASKLSGLPMAATGGGGGDNTPSGSKQQPFPPARKGTAKPPTPPAIREPCPLPAGMARLSDVLSVPLRPGRRRPITNTRAGEERKEDGCYAKTMQDAQDFDQVFRSGMEASLRRMERAPQSLPSPEEVERSIEERLQYDHGEPVRRIECEEGCCLSRRVWGRRGWQEPMG